MVRRQIVHSHHPVAVLLMLLCCGNNVLDGFGTHQQKSLTRRECLAGAAVTGLSTLLVPTVAV